MSRKVDLTDPDNPEWTEADFARAKPVNEMPEHIQKVFKRPPGRPRVAAPKPVVSLRMDQDVLDYFKSTGPGWRYRINEILAKEAGRR